MSAPNSAPTEAQEKKEEERSRHEAGGAPGAPQVRAPGDLPDWMRGRTAATSRAVGAEPAPVAKAAPAAPAAKGPTLRDRAALRAAMLRDAWDAWRWKTAAKWGAVSLAVAIALAVLAWMAFDGRFGVMPYFNPAPPAMVDDTPPPPPPSPQERRALDGVMVDVGSVPADLDYVAVAIDNHPDAMPQSGVAEATLVIEAPVEGGLTRLLAFFPSDATFAAVGPVRSARPYFVDWAHEYGALYVHVGGSPDALEKLRASDVRDQDEFFHGADFWRDKKRFAPHSTFTSSELLAKVFAKRPRTFGAVEPWKYRDEPPLEERPEDQFEVTLGKIGAWRVRWRYDRDKNEYVRVISSGVQKDAAGAEVRAKNVLVQFVDVEVLDKVGRLRVDVRSGGDAKIIRDGAIIGGTWKKASADQRTRFYDAAGVEVSLNAGTTWIEAVAEGTPVTD